MRERVHYIEHIPVSKQVCIGGPTYSEEVGNSNKISDDLEEKGVS